ncbi:MAG: hypothetical protein JWP06_765 [Candidatus Saccharibacteria bacterium]|nr:hypothetical protein [Candidatus Saccharibacteria bacterium]
MLQAGRPLAHEEADRILRVQVSSSGDDLDQRAVTLEGVRNATIAVRDPARDPVPAERQVQVAVHRLLCRQGAEAGTTRLDQSTRLLGRCAGRHRPELEEVQLTRASDTASLVDQHDRAVLELVHARTDAVCRKEIWAVGVDDRYLAVHDGQDRLRRSNHGELLRDRRRLDVARRTQLGDVVHPRRQDPVELVRAGERESAVKRRLRRRRIRSREPLNRSFSDRPTLTGFGDLLVDLRHGDAGRQLHDLQIASRKGGAELGLHDLAGLEDRTLVDRDRARRILADDQVVGASSNRRRSRRGQAADDQD